ncbi:SAM-dependent methyltransferase [Actinoallomurus bryophytorum]|uniref:S-adenosyl methyltransferase n=1 Tax=Actinoallomurus bryophytorum TaxID=1490222 RepID=A0A543CPX8_9ACTN|nr:SAM-dependent methyltransferase [Actinoallomurus bryophytorum]TQL99139.1 S-adenosyl methyltransferase [Actinoallomurus bryophytorum]
MSEDERVPPDVDVTVPSIARVYDYMLGGKDNFAIDRQVAEMTLKIVPEAPITSRANRDFLQRVVRHLTEEMGIRQFLDFGSGLPTQGNVHEIAQRIAPETHVVYVDSDPIVLTHGRALLARDGTTAIVEADIRRPEAILNHPEVRQLIDFERPVGLLFFAILHHLNDHEDPAGIVERVAGAASAGSHVAITHFHNPGAEHPEVAEQAAASEKLFNERFGTGRWRTREEILRYFEGLELLEPGLVPLPLWRPYPEGDQQIGSTAGGLVPIHRALVGGVARKA